MSTFEPSWMCGRATKMRPLVTNGILISTGGGSSFSDSVASSYFQCSALDIIAIHDFSNANIDYLQNLEFAAGNATAYNKSIILEEFGTQSSGWKGVKKYYTKVKSNV